MWMLSAVHAVTPTVTASRHPPHCINAGSCSCLAGENLAVVDIPGTNAHKHCHPGAPTLGPPGGTGGVATV